jgi:hypothetical protein
MGRYRPSCHSEVKEETYSMKNRKRSAMAAAATIAASVALMFGASAPASASTAGVIYCPSTMVARMSFTSKVHTVVYWNTINGGQIAALNINASTKTIYVYAPRSGPIRYSLATNVTGLYVTCVV